MKRLNIVLILVVCLAVIFTGCGNAGGGGAANQWAADSAAPEAPAPPATADVAVDEVLYLSAIHSNGAMAGSGYATGSDGTHISTAAEQRMIVTTASFSINTDDFDVAMHELNQMIRVSGGFVQQSESFAPTEWRGAFAHLTVRIPTQRYDGFRDFLMDLGEVTFFSEGGEDVTVQFFDTEARLAILREQEIRIRSFIEHAQNLEEIFLIERELTRISTEIEQLTTVRDRLRNLVSYATIYINISDGEFAPPATGFGARVDGAFSSSLEGIVFAVQSIILLIVGLWPLIIVAAVVLFFVLRARKRRKEKEEEKRQSQMQQVYQAQQTSQTDAT